MDHADRVSGREGIQRLRRDPRDALGGQRATLHRGAQRLAVDQLHDEPAGLGIDVVHRRDVRVVHACRGAGLAREPLALARLVGALQRGGLDQLDRDVAPQDRVVDAIDPPHAAGADLRDHAIAFWQRVRERRLHGGLRCRERGLVVRAGHPSVIVA